MTPCLKIRYRGNHFAANYKREGLISRGDDAPVEMSVLTFSRLLMKVFLTIADIIACLSPMAAPPSVVWQVACRAH